MENVNYLQNLTYEYDNIGNITKITDTSDTNANKIVDYSYDGLSRLTRASSTNAINNQNYLESYSYNAIGNMMNKSNIGNYVYSDNGYNNPQAVTNVNGTSYTYDNNGNLTSDGQWTHSWDYLNRLIQSTKGTSTIRYTYDDQGSRVNYAVNGIATTTEVNKLYTINPTGSSTLNIYANNQLIATIEGSSTYYTHTDHLGGSNVITDNSGNTISELIDYYPFGGIRLDEKNGFSQRKKFTGYVQDDDTGLSYANARYQNGSLGRFISQDPVVRELGTDLKKKFLQYNFDKELFDIILNPQELNSYSYVSNNPLTQIDPWGLAKVYIRQMLDNNNGDKNQKMGHTIIEVKGTFYGFAPLDDKRTNNDVQVYKDEQAFKEAYAGQEWKIVDIGKNWDNNIIDEIQKLQSEGGTKEGTYRTLTNNCTQKAQEILKNAGVWNGKVPMKPALTPDQLYHNFEWYKAGESVYKFFNKSYQPLIKSINKTTINMSSW